MQAPTRGQMIKIKAFIIALYSLAALGCFESKNNPPSALIFFIEDTLPDELSCQSRVTSHPISGIRMLCEKGALDLALQSPSPNTLDNIVAWISQGSQLFHPPKLYQLGWSTGYFPSTPELTTATITEFGYEFVTDTFPVTDGLWYTDAPSQVEALTRFLDVSPSRFPPYALLTFSDLSFQWTKKTSRRGLEVTPSREESWEAIDNAIHKVLTHIDFERNFEQYLILILGSPHKLGAGNAIFYRPPAKQNTKAQKNLKLEVSLPHLSSVFHSMLYGTEATETPPQLFSPAKKPTSTSVLALFMSELQSPEVEPSIFEKLSFEFPELTACLLSPESCPQLLYYKKWLRDLRDSKKLRQLGSVKLATQGFFINESLGNVLHLNKEQRLRMLYLYWSLKELN